MAESEQTSQEKKLTDLTWSIGFGLVTLLISILFTYSAFFETDTQNNFPILFLITFLVLTWSLTICCFSELFRTPLIRRIHQWSGFTSGASFVIFLLLIISKQMLARDDRHMKSFNGNETFFVLVVAFIIIGLFLFFTSKYKKNKQSQDSTSDSIASSPLIIVFWPIIIPLLNPLFLFWLSCVIALTILGNWIGSKFAYPLIGAVCGFALLPIVMSLLLAFIFRKDRIKRDSQKNTENPPQPSQKNQT